MKVQPKEIWLKIFFSAPSPPLKSPTQSIGCKNRLLRELSLSPPFSDGGRIPSEKTCSSHSQVAVLRAEVHGWLPIIAEVVRGYVVSQCTFDLLVRTVLKNCADQAAAVKAQLDGAEISVCSQHT